MRACSELRMATTSIVMGISSIALEAVSTGFRSISLGFRFMANLAAGHVLSDISSAVKYSSRVAVAGLIGSVLKMSIVSYEAIVLTIQCSVLVALLAVYSDLA